MAKNINVKQPHNTTKDAALEKLRTMSAQLSAKYGLTVTPSTSGASFKGKGITGTCAIDDTKVTLDLALGILMRPLSSRLEAGIKKQMGEHFG
ncbi:MAG: putative polyhydroxyalkanoate system protein [Bradymonadia bacterium]